VSLPAGTSITLSLALPNRDPAQFSDPERFDMPAPRTGISPSAPAAHQCAGMAHGRGLESAIAIPRLLARFPHYALEWRARARRACAVSRIFERAVRCGVRHYF